MRIDKRQSGQLPDELGSILPELFRKTQCDDWELMRPSLPRRESTVYFLRSARFRLPALILKHYRKNAVRRHLALDLHSKSELLHRSATAGCSIPEPILCVPGENALAMEYVDAPITGSLLRRGFHSRQTRDAINRNAARWLRWFHGQAEVVPERFDALAVFANISKTVEKIRARDPDALARDEFLNECVEFAGKIAREADGVPILHAITHGDFTPFNLFTRGGTTVGFDYQVKHRRPVTQDICRFLLYLEVSQIIPTRPSELREHGCRSRDLTAFMDAYGAGHDLLENGLWLRLQFLEITRRIASLSLPRASKWNRPFRLIEAAGLRRNARHVLETLA